MIRGWLADRWRFVADPKGLERVTTPHQLLLDFQRTATLAGDCDDVAVLAASMGLIAGLRSRYVAVGFEGPTRPVRHVFAELATPLGWVDMDITRPADIPPVNRVITVDI